MFMYASAFSIAKQINRDFFIDNETAFLLKKNISNYGLHNFNISAKIADDKFKFKNLKGYLFRKLLIKTDLFRTYKKFYIEKKNIDKITSFNSDFIKKKFSSYFFLEGHFESEKYFVNYKDEILEEFSFVDKDKFNNVLYLKEINQTNSVGICLRQNRFNEGKGRLNIENIKKSNKFVDEQILYINKSVKFLNSKIRNLNFFIWSNDKLEINDKRFSFEYKIVNLEKYNKLFDLRILSLYLLKHCKHHIVTPTSFNWWGAWLSDNPNKIILRPSSSFFNDFKLNNKDFWPDSWFEIS